MPIRPRRPRFVHSAAALALAALAARDVRADCIPWPGEPDPLPSTAASDPFEARWAELRADELAAVAAQVEPVDPSGAGPIWVHVVCLDPSRTEAEEAVARTRPLQVHRPEVVAGAAPDAVPAPTVAAALARLDEPVYLRPAPRAVAAVAPPAVSAAPPADAAPRDDAPAPRAAIAAADDLLGQAETLLREARFEDALDRASRARAELPAARDGAVAARRARAEVAAGTAQLALGRDGDARASFERALRADPAYRPEPSRTSPKVMRAFDAARAAVETTP